MFPLTFQAYVRYEKTLKTGIRLKRKWKHLDILHGTTHSICSFIRFNNCTTGIKYFSTTAFHCSLYYFYHLFTQSMLSLCICISVLRYVLHLDWYLYKAGNPIAKFKLNWVVQQEKVKKYCIKILEIYWKNTGYILKRCPAKYQRLVMTSGAYYVKYCVRNCLDNTECTYNIVLLNAKGLSW